MESTGDTFSVVPYGKYFAVYQKFDRLLPEEDDQPPKLVCVAVYRVGAEEVKQRLEGKVLVKKHRVLCRACRKTIPAHFTDAEIAAEP